MDGYWKHCIRDDRDREFVASRIEQVRSGNRGWEDEEYRKWVRQRAQERSNSSAGERTSTDTDPQEFNVETPSVETKKTKWCSIL